MNVEHLLDSWAEAAFRAMPWGSHREKPSWSTLARRGQEGWRRVALAILGEILVPATFSKACKQARSEGLSLSEYLSKAVDTDIAVAEISREKIG